MKVRIIFFFLMLFCLIPIQDLSAKTERYVLTICGSGGDEAYTQKFLEWGHRFEELITNRFAVPQDNFFLLTELDENSHMQATLLNIDKVCEKLKNISAPDDEIIIVLIGHGSYLKGKSKFHIPGPDLTASHLLQLLQEIQCRRQILINSASSSAGFINVLSNPNRMICTATKSTDEKNATEFMEFFLHGLEQNHADINRDQRITLLEACLYAAMQTAQWYTTKGLLETEHALIDCNGDGLGERLYESDKEEIPPETISETSDIGIAQRVILLDESFPHSAPQEQIDAYLAVLDKIEEFKRHKNDMEEKEYYLKLESLLIRAALIHRNIRNATASPDILN